ncbi:rod shape-determining protein MreC [Desulfuribacillus alkaliarsenatis]|uniref:Cell shape-determining protein MreC n=1 Tax=Desulfuribacillus alkaliarsenatis TaxID=766136 RepID=A0A1E5G585_9FIRM|nr:rod shape-determining protein MreC [Desulfuribacillus alkaliarsenatis]OEF98347.1 rod shape-determining protein MreC [Desulfuribacillus alkaliarsenatis]
MENWFGQRRWMIIFIAIIVLALVMSLTVKGREEVTLPEKIILDTSAFIQKMIYKPANYVAGLYDDIRRINNLYEENHALRNTLNSMAFIQAELKIVNDENERLRKLLDLEESIRDYDLVAANVVGRSPARWDNLITIDRGSAHGIERNMAVINQEGLIGRVYTVSNYSAKVLLITDSSAPSGISAVILGKDESFGVIEEYLPEHGFLQMSMIRPDVQLERGDLVVTSGLGEVFPKGLVIGTVEAGRRTEGGLTQSVFVKPAVSTHSLNEVMVIRQTLVIDDSFNDTIDRIEDEQTVGEGTES